MILVILVGLYCLFRKKITINRRLALVGRQAQAFGIMLMGFGILVLPYRLAAMRMVATDEQIEDYGTIFTVVLILAAATGLGLIAKKWVKNSPVPEA